MTPVAASAPAPLPITYHGLLYEPRRYPDVKDPSLVFDGHRWHVFGTGCGLPGGAEILRATTDPAAITAAQADAKPTKRATVQADLESLALPA